MTDAQILDELGVWLKEWEVHLDQGYNLYGDFGRGRYDMTARALEKLKELRGK